MQKQFRRFGSIATLLVLVLALAGCAASAHSHQDWKQLATISDLRLGELSGLSESIRYPGYFWANNDSGDWLRCFLISPKGQTVAVVNLQGYDNVDTETLRVMGTAQKSFVYIGDSGDNRARRKHIAIYRFKEPKIDISKRDQKIKLRPQQMILKYGDGNATDAETLLVTPSGNMAIVTKSLLGSKLWFAPKSFPDKPQTLSLAGKVPIGKWRQRGENYSMLITDGAISNDGQYLALMTYTTLFMWKIDPKSTFLQIAKVLSKPPTFQRSLPALKQAESLSFVDNKNTLKIAVSSEGKNPPIMVSQFEAR